MRLDAMTKKEIQGVHEAYWSPLFNRHCERFYSSDTKTQNVQYVLGQLQFHANLQAAHELTDEQVDAFGLWLEAKHARNQRTLSPREWPHGVWLLSQELSGVKKTGTLTGKAWERYRRAHLRHVASFVFHFFLDEVKTGSAEISGIKDRLQRIEADLGTVSNSPSASLGEAEIKKRLCKIERLADQADRLQVDAEAAGLTGQLARIESLIEEIEVKQAVYEERKKQLEGLLEEAIA